MLGRKQSIKVENMADYGNEEMLHESADVEWVNKVSFLQFFHVIRSRHKFQFFFSALGSTTYETLCPFITPLSMSQHPKDL
jgi:hypothetical protein